MHASQLPGGGSSARPGCCLGRRQPAVLAGCCPGPRRLGVWQLRPCPLWARRPRALWRGAAARAAARAGGARAAARPVGGHPCVQEAGLAWWPPWREMSRPRGGEARPPAQVRLQQGAGTEGACAAVSTAVHQAPRLCCRRTTSQCNFRPRPLDNEQRAGIWLRGRPACFGSPRGGGGRRGARGHRAGHRLATTAGRATAWQHAAVNITARQ
jgi:hypothetical protein